MYSRRHLLVTALALVAGKAAGQEPPTKRLSVAASRYTFEPLRIEVTQNDLVRIELRTLDIAHSMTIDDYRISKRVNPGTTVTFEFRADREGTFPFYCNLQIDEGCRQMRGELVVRPRR
jgi:heme/copper-type cytochrome/quinol oxidase subunit 2